MARDLSFWKYKDGSERLEHSKIYEKLSNAEYVEGVAEIPVDLVKAEIEKVYISWEKEDENSYVLGSEVFELMLTNQFIRIDCYGMTEEHMNQMIDVMDKFDCPLYDSTIDVRFDGE
ncbi:MAG: hypothetical protein K0R50_1544 [Eubacterium sp.]|jgi:hypothetical protein|nr:hypothetical protein [Eubacterium sp.]